MSEIKHTPGPWFFAGKHPECEVRYVSLNVEDHFDGEIATLYHGEGAMQEANARLIAAAPELLEALLWCKSQGWLQYTKRIPNQNAAFCDGVDKALAAIAKATGSQS
jgi:hypothetical protein